MLKFRLFWLLVFILMVVNRPMPLAQASPIFAADVIVSGTDFAGGEMWQIEVTNEGLMLAAAAAHGSYTSPILTAPLPFNAAVPQWVASLPPDTHINIRLRTANAAGLWNDWFDIVPNDDWMRPEDLDIVGNMIAVPDADGTHIQFQYQVGFSRLTAQAAPRLREIRFTFIDATAGPTSEQLAILARAEAEETPHSPENGYPKPPVVSRANWCTDPACNYTNGLEYHPVTHLIVHHTVSANSSANWAAVVRAIWHFHTFTRGWGDIGYNYLVDMNGVLYEGHNGGDDVIGTHASGANKGSMALAFIGTFTLPGENPPGITPPPAMLDAAVELFAWKADQKQIDVYDSSQLPNMGWGLPHLMGHRDAYGTTACPGEQAHDLIPWIRNTVAAQLGFTPPHTYIDNLSSAFTKSNSTWTDGPSSCGFNVHAWYARSTTGPATHWGRWQLAVPQAGEYEIEVYAPYCRTGFADTRGAQYQVHHANGMTTVVVNQEANLGLWVSLGYFQLTPGGNQSVYLDNRTTTDSNLGLWYDAIRLRPRPAAPPTVTPQLPSANTWLTDPTVTFQWYVAPAGQVQSTLLEVATNPSFNSLVFSQTLGIQTSYTYTFTQDYRDLFWRVTLNTVANGSITSAATHFGLDTTPPVSAVTGIYRLNEEDPDYLIFWGGTDITSGIAGYTIEYQAEGATDWTRWFTGTTATSATFLPPDPDVIYWFRAQATDVAGNSESPHTEGDISTAQVVLLDKRMMLPIIQR